MPAPVRSTATPTGFFAADLGHHGDAIALLTETDVVSYTDLAGRAEVVAQRLAGPRRLVLQACSNTIETIVAYLGILRAGHVALLVAADSPRAIETMISAYAPDTVITPDLSIEHRHDEPVHTLHPDLALLLSTSGTTGSPKLVRLSYENLQANAESIAAYLRIRETDRGVTTLPLSYCYGLSVLHSHMLRGAGIIVTDRSVSDDAFWELLRARGGTSFAGVPYTFDLLDRIGFADRGLPSLRYVTQAGGRLDPDRVRRYAELGQEQGWDLFVMYGQTEATARMAYLPPHLATRHPQAIGIPIPGGSFRLAPLEDASDGDRELVYSGPNVMLGYATGPADLAAGPTVNELRTGDLARVNDAGLYEIVGRRSRFLKLFGLRVDLQRVEDRLAAQGLTAACTGTDSGLVVAVVGGPDETGVGDTIAAEYGLPRHAVTVHMMGELPRLPSGKPDFAAIRSLAAAAGVPEDKPAWDREEAVRDLYARALGAKRVRAADTFIGLGGDSLSYVAISIKLERLIGPLPPSWPSMPIRDLVAPTAKVRPAMDTTILLRAASIVFIVLTHLKLAILPGGSQVMLCVAAYNFARFNLSAADRAGRARRILRSALGIYLPAAVWVAVAIVAFDKYSPVNLVMANYLIGGDNQRDEWHYWFLETLLYYLAACTALLVTPWGDRIERRFPFALPATLMMSGPVIRFLLGLHSPSQYDPATPILLFWIFAVGWAAARADALWQRLLVSATVLATVPGFFLAWQRATIVTFGILLLVWVRALPSRRWINIGVGTIASASLYIYITHWQVMSRLEQRGFSVAVALIACFAVGIGYGEVVRRLSGRGLLRRFSREPAEPAGVPDTA